MKKTRVVIVGMGIVGACCAYFAARSGFKVEAFDMGEVGSGTTDATGSFVAVITKKSKTLLNLTLRSMALYEELVKDIDIPYWVNGSYILFCTIEEKIFLEKRAKWLIKQGIDVQFLTRIELKKLLPGIHQNIKGALYTEKDAGISPKNSCLSISKEAEKFGALIKTNTIVKGFHIVNDKIKGVVTSKGIIESDYVVLAAGPWSAGLIEQVGLKIPLTLQKGETLITEPVDFYIKGQILAADILIKKIKHNFTDKFSVGMAVSQEPDMSIKIGATREWTNFDLMTSKRGRKALLEEVEKYFPNLSNLHISHQVVGFRAFSQFNRPLICKIKKPEGLILACGHGGDGVALAPASGWIVAQILSGNKTGFEHELDLRKDCNNDF